MTFSMIFILQGQGGAGMINLIFMAVLFSLFYFFFIRPQAKKQKEQIAFMNAIQKGDEVVPVSYTHLTLPTSDLV